MFIRPCTGLTHFCRSTVEDALQDHAKAALLHTLWTAETPFIYWRTPWIGYEYNNPEKPNPGFLPLETQQVLVKRTAEEFQKFFSRSPVSACAPGYRANESTHQAWADCGVKVAQNGSGAPLPPHFDDCEILNLYRTIDIEPASRELRSRSMYNSRRAISRGEFQRSSRCIQSTFIPL